MPPKKKVRPATAESLSFFLRESGSLVQMVWSQQAISDRNASWSICTVDKSSSMCFHASSCLPRNEWLTSSEEKRISKLSSPDSSSGLLTPVTSKILDTLTSTFSSGSIQTTSSLHVVACSFQPNGNSTFWSDRVSSSPLRCLFRHFISKICSALMTSSSMFTSLLVLMDTRKSGHSPRRQTSPLKSRSVEVVALYICKPLSVEVKRGGWLGIQNYKSFVKSTTSRNMYCAYFRRQLQ